MQKLVLETFWKTADIFHITSKIRRCNKKKNSQERNFINVQDWILRSKNIKTFILED